MTGRSIVLILAETPVAIRRQALGHLQSLILVDTVMENVDHAVIVERFADHPDEDALMARIRETWPSAFEVRGEERLRGIGHYMSPKLWVANSVLPSTTPLRCR